jgi:hypothetical protein
VPHGIEAFGEQLKGGIEARLTVRALDDVDRGDGVSEQQRTPTENLREGAPGRSDLQGDGEPTRGEDFGEGHASLACGAHQPGV